MPGRPGAFMAAALALVAAVAACTADDPSRPPPPERPRATSQEPPADRGPELADMAFRVGPAEVVMGPSRFIDSLVNGIKVGDTVRAYVANTHTVVLEGSSAADLAPTGERALEAGTDPGQWDDCGAWLEGVERDVEDPRLLRAWYHAEWQCDYPNNQTHKSVAYAESRDGGKTFTKPGYPRNQVLTSPTGSVEGHHTGRGGPSIVRRGGYYYLYYLNVLPSLKTVTSVARAPVSSGGVPGSWRSYTVDDNGRGRWEQDARGGAAAALDTDPTAASASVHLPSGEVLLVRQDTQSGGITLQASTDGTDFTRLPEPIVPYLPSQIRTDWSGGTDGQIFGYTSIIGPDGSRFWRDTFYLFHLYVFPGDTLQGARYLVRREVSVTGARESRPRSTVALSSYAGGGDRFATSAPLKPGPAFEGVVGHLLATPSGDRRALFECTTAAGDRTVGAGCGAGQLGRLAGYAYDDEQPGTARLVSCRAGGDVHAALAADCGAVVTELGWIYPPSFGGAPNSTP